MAMKRTSIHLEEGNYETIQEIASRRGVAAAQLIREACDVILGFGELTEYDTETLAMLREQYPRMHFPEIVRELMFQWRLRRANGGGKDDKLAVAITILKEIKADQATIMQAMGITTTTTTTTTENEPTKAEIAQK